MRKHSAFKASLLLGVCLFTAVGCASTGDIRISEDPDNRGELIADYSQTFTVTAKDINDTARVLPSGFDFDCSILESNFDFGADYTITKQENTQRQSCTFEFEGLSLDELSDVISSADGGGYNLEVFHFKEDGLVVVEANSVLVDDAQEIVDDLENEIEGYGSTDINEEINNAQSEEDAVDSVSDVLEEQRNELIFEFPGNIVHYTDGSLIAQRDYDNSVDRTRIANQDVNNANIIHLEGNEVFADFQVVAEDGLGMQWWHWLLWIGGGTLGLAAIGLIVMIVLSNKKDTTTRFSKAGAKDPHDFTLDNPNGEELPTRQDKGKLPKRT